MPEYKPFSAATEWPSEPLPDLPEPDNHFDDLDGTTREELVRAQIAKHRELLTPDAPVNVSLKNEKFFVELKHERT